jgi:hypothetical protein
MNKSNLTLVTALFDIGRGEMETSFSRSFEHYKECFSRLLKLDFNLVIFCEPELNEFIWSYRKKENTQIINRNKDDLRAFPFYSKIQEIRQKPSWINQAGWIADSTQAKLELYNPLVMSKQFYLNDATLFNYFNTDYFLWVDAGISNTVSVEKYFDATFEKRITKHLNKMLYICFPYDGTTEVHGFEKNKMNQLADCNTEFVARGGIFGGPKFIINEMNDIYYNLLDQSLSNGFMGTEESIFTIMAYRHRSKCNIRMIEGNGLVYKFFEDLQKEPLATAESSLALYVLTFNLPAQFELWINAFKKAFPNDFNKLKKYVINNSNDASVKEAYDTLFKNNNLEVIHEGSNVGINDGRHIAAEHFDKSDHDYMIFFEDDMLMHDSSVKQCKSGFATYTDNLFQKAIQIVENHDLDYLKLSFSEFFGDCHDDWSWYNVPDPSRRKEYFPDESNGLEKKTKIQYTGTHRGLPFAVGYYHYCNWPLVFSKRGNKRIFMDVQYEHKYEQTIMSHVRGLLHEKKVKAGCLLLSPINHDRKFHYQADKRRENKHYKN